MLATIVISVIVFLLVLTIKQGGETTLVVCNSISCKWNKLCRCTRKRIAVYDNAVKGLCVHHSEDVMDRIEGAIKIGREVGAVDGKIEATGAIRRAIEASEDSAMLRDDKEFERWMRKRFG